MAIHSTRSSRSSTSHRAIRGTSTSKTTVPMAYESKIPAGRYRSKIVSVTDSTTASGDDAIDVVYQLTSPTGASYQMRERIPFDTYPYILFGNAMIAAGLNPGDDPVKAVGVEENVLLYYPSPGAIGHFSKRKPITSKASTALDDDDEDAAPPGVDDNEDDYLAFEED